MSCFCIIHIHYLPGFLLSDKIGRRWTHSTLLFINALFFCLVMVLIPHQVAQGFLKKVQNKFQATSSAAAVAIQVLCMVLKMNISATFLVAYIQAMEIFPTPVRQSGIGFCSFISQMISIGGPYTIALGASNLMVSLIVAQKCSSF